MLVLFIIWSVFFGFWQQIIGFLTTTHCKHHYSCCSNITFGFTNAIFVDAERDGHKWLKEWKEEQSRYKLIVNRLKTKNLVIWNPNKEG